MNHEMTPADSKIASSEQESLQSNGELRYHPTERPGIFVITQGYDEEIPQDLEQKLLKDRDELVRTSSSVARHKKVVDRLKSYVPRYEWLRGIRNERNRTEVRLVESTYVKDPDEFKKTFGSNYSYVAPEEIHELTFVAPTGGLTTKTGEVIDVQQLIMEQIPNVLIQRGADPEEVQRRMKAKTTPRVIRERVRELQANGFEVPSNLIFTNLSVRTSGKLKNPLRPEDIANHQE